MKSCTISLRRATLADRKGVLAIDPMLFDGLDYMIAIYTTILQNHNFRSYVAESTDGKIVGFLSVMVDAEEKFCGVLSGRTMREFQGQGINQMLKTRALTDLHSEFGENFGQLYTAAEKHLYTRQFWSDPARHLLLRYAFLVYIAPYTRIVDAVAAFRSSPHVTAVNIKELGPDEAVNMMTNEYALQHLLRSSHVIAFCNSLPFPTSLKYIRRIASQTNVFASFKTKANTHPNGLSYSSLIKGPLYIHLNICVMVYDHVDILIAHLTCHLAHVTKVVPPEATVGIRLRFPTEIDKEVVKKALLPTIGVNRVGKVHPREYMVLWNESRMEAKL